MSPHQPTSPVRRVSVLRQARSRKTRRELVATAIRLWSTRDFDDITVDEIVDAADVSKGTFYYHFRRKEDLLVELGWATVDRVGSEAESAYEQGASLDEAVDVALSGLARRVLAMPRGAVTRTIQEFTLARPNTPESRESSRVGFLSGLLSAAKRAGDLSASVDTLELATVANQVIIRTILDAFAGDDPRVLEPMLRRRVRLVLYGMDAAYAPAAPARSVKKRR